MVSETAAGWENDLVETMVSYWVLPLEIDKVELMVGQKVNLEVA